MLFLFSSFGLNAQDGRITGDVTCNKQPVAFANVYIESLQKGVSTNEHGHFEFTDIPLGTHKLVVSMIGYETATRKISVDGSLHSLIIELKEITTQLEEVVISGTMKEMSKLDSPVPVEVYTAEFFKSNPSATVFESMQNVTGVRPQINCNVCNTGDIHINGLEGPYTMVLIDGMPLVSGLSTVYGLSGIPQSLIERVEIVKGPASTLYGSEAVGGLINIITKKHQNAPLFSADVFATSWGEINADIAGKFSIKKMDTFLGINGFDYSLPTDRNNDGFTDLTLQKRLSIFNKWKLNRYDQRELSLAVRYFTEDRWGGEMDWTTADRGGSSVYGESIYTKRWEVFGAYQLPFDERVMVQFSANGHLQDSYYGNLPFAAQQYIAFGQLTWNKELKNNDLLLGGSYRYVYYDDNTYATIDIDTAGGTMNQPALTHLPGIFLQDEIYLNDQNKVLLGVRYDYHSAHRHIVTPRMNYKWTSESQNQVIRMSVGNGYRVVNVFTEDHASLTGARQVEFLSDLEPETSWNGNLNFVNKKYFGSGTYFGLDLTAFYTHFSNKIIADYEQDPNKIVYDNLNGYAVSRGVSVNTDLTLQNGIKLTAGCTFMDVFSVNDNVRADLLFTEKFNGTWSIGYTIAFLGMSVDYTGNVYSPMQLPLLSENDPRRPQSPWWSIQNIKLSKSLKNGIEVYGGVKNLLNWTPNNGNPFIIARANDPFDQQVQFDSNGQAMVTPNNPYGLTFDPTYVYGPNQGIRGFIGVSYQLER
ncbi:MAG: TonB-dependent receptor plug domain-containing protein [Cryomorphaceae bacterium]|nr:TonB-dependent receptor plug domain-containing protein [Cryomorphaceae bacterium]